MNSFVLIDYLGVFVFAITGAGVATRSGFDFFGMLFLAFLTAVGGGTIRDLILGQSVFWTVNSIYLYIIILATFASFFLKLVKKQSSPILLFLDTLGLGAFAVFGTQKALHIGSNVETAILMGVISGVLGGVLRSIFNNETPIIFKKEIYATSAAIGSILYVVLAYLDVDTEISMLLAILSCIFIRYASIKYNIHLPRAK